MVLSVVALADAVAIEWWGKAGETTSEEVMSASHPANHRGVASHRRGDPAGRAERAADAGSQRAGLHSASRSRFGNSGSAQDPDRSAPTLISNRTGHGLSAISPSPKSPGEAMITATLEMGSHITPLHRGRWPYAHARASCLPVMPSRWGNRQRSSATHLDLHALWLSCAV